MAVDKDYFLRVAGEFKNEAPEDIQFWVDLALGELNKNGIWGDRLDYATALLAAHMFKMAKRRGQGMTTQHKVGDISKNFLEPQHKHELLQTSYGTEFYRLRRTRVITPLVSP